MSFVGHHIAVDLGAGSGRLMALDFRSGIPMLSEVHRFGSEPVATPTGTHWNMLQTLSDIRVGLARAREQFGSAADSLAVDSWGVDYALLDKGGHPLGAPYFYRDSRTRGAEARLRSRLSDDELFLRTGSQPRAINTLYQLLAEQAERPAALAGADRIAFIPDLINHWLTGEFRHENTIASTSGLWNPADRDWNRPLIAELGLPDTIFRPLSEPGDTVGVCDDIPVLLCASHDTASAIHAVMGEPGQATLSIGSWAIVSWVLDRPTIHLGSGRLGFAVEGCPGGHWRYARNQTGLWLMQRYRALLGGSIDYASLEAAATVSPSIDSVLATDDPDLVNPRDILAVMSEQLARSGQPVPADFGAWARLIYRSLAVSFTRSLIALSAATNEPVRTVRVIGGGAKSPLLCQMIADASRLPVVAGPVEATAWGNLLVQVRACHGGTDADWRQRFSSSWMERHHEPRPSAELEDAMTRH